MDRRAICRVLAVGPMTLATGAQLFALSNLLMVRHRIR